MIYTDMLLGADGDLVLNEQGDIVLSNSIVQKINIRIKWFLGEWPFDESQGYDWYETVFVKNPDEDEIKRLIEEAILSVDDVQNVESVEMTVDKKKRTALIKWKANAKDEQTIESEVSIWETITG
jgi:hypothetical protein